MDDVPESHLSSLPFRCTSSGKGESWSSGDPADVVHQKSLTTRTGQVESKAYANQVLSKLLSLLFLGDSQFVQLLGDIGTGAGGLDRLVDEQ